MNAVYLKTAKLRERETVTMKSLDLNKSNQQSYAKFPNAVNLVAE